MEKPITISVFTDNSPGVLHRITVIFTRRKVNIESLTVSETERKGVSRFTIVANIEEEMATKIVKAITRIVEVSVAYWSLNGELLSVEVAYLRVHTTNSKEREEIEKLTERYNAHVVFVDGSSVVVRKTGTEDEINSLYFLLERYGIKEFIRSGRIAIRKNFKAPYTKFDIY